MYNVNLSLKIPILLDKESSVTVKNAFSLGDLVGTLVLWYTPKQYNLLLLQIYYVLQKML